MHARWLYILQVFLLVSCTSHPDETGYTNPDLQIERLHSDLPLFTDIDDMWPRHFSEDGSFGCVTRIALGDWVFREQGSDEIVWYKIDNYGVFHCWALFGKSYDREELSAVDMKPAFFVFLGEEAGRELWVAQIGVVPGSEYMLLARSPADGVIDDFDVLQMRCPQNYLRDVGALDILITRYCAVNDPAALEQLAREMIQLPVLGKLSLAPNKSEKAQ